MALKPLLAFLFFISVSAASYSWDLEQQNFYYHNIKKLVNTISDRVPGPFIFAEKGEQLEIVVKNLFITQASTVHWHGMDQQGTNYMDGVPDITECGIKPNSQFTYAFEAYPAGTHWFHSHSGAQYMDGHFGVMIVKDPEDPHLDKYDFDLEEHVIIFNDWFEEPGEELIVDLINGQFQGGPVSDIPWGGNDASAEWSGAMINGYVGPYDAVPMDEQKLGYAQAFNPNDYPVFKVTKGKKYRFRMVNGASNMGFRFSIDDHKIKIIAASGGNMQPHTVDSYITFPGERFDYVLDASNDVGNYWMRFENAHGEVVRAILRYDGADEEYPDPSDDCPKTSQCYKYQVYIEEAIKEDSAEDFTSHCCNEGRWPEIDPCCQAGMGDFIPGMYDLKSLDTTVPKKNGKADVEESFTILGIMKPEFVLHLNSKIFAFPTVPLIFSRGKYGLVEADYVSIAGDESFLRSNYTELIDAMGNITVETQVKFVDYNDVVDIVFNNHGPMIHPFHLHGHRFWVLGNSLPLTEPIAHQDTSLDLYKEYDSKKDTLNYDDPPYVDTVPVPDHGWVYIRYKATNVGAWIIHCHLDPHLAAGMSVVFLTGQNRADWPSPPDDFPICGVNEGIGKVSDLALNGRVVTWGEPEYGVPDYFKVLIKKNGVTKFKSDSIDGTLRTYTIPDSVELSGTFRVNLKAVNDFGRISNRRLKVTL